MCFFFFKQKTAYEMRISDWSSDVCSSDLHFRRQPARVLIVAGAVTAVENQNARRHAVPPAMTERAFGQLPAQRLDGGLMRDLPQRHPRLQIPQRARPGLQEEAAVPHSLGSRLALRRSAPDRVQEIGR